MLSDFFVFLSFYFGFLFWISVPVLLAGVIDFQTWLITVCLSTPLVFIMRRMYLKSHRTRSRRSRESVPRYVTAASVNTYLKNHRARGRQGALAMARDRRAILDNRRFHVFENRWTKSKGPELSAIAEGVEQ